MFQGHRALFASVSPWFAKVRFRRKMLVNHVCFQVLSFVPPGGHLALVEYPTPIMTALVNLLYTGCAQVSHRGSG